jgi:histidine ammonia-lyase
MALLNGTQILTTLSLLDLFGAEYLLVAGLIVYSLTLEVI